MCACEHTNAMDHMGKSEDILVLFFHSELQALNLYGKHLSLLSIWLAHFLLFILRQNLRVLLYTLGWP